MTRPRRSVLFSPGDRPELVRKAPRSDADTYVFDLEDAVAPSRKAEARTAVAEILSDPGFDPAGEVCVRINPGAAGREDLSVVLEGDPRIDAVMVPKVTAPATVTDVAAAVSERGRDLAVFALLENARGVLNAADVAAADVTDAVVFGAEDLAADLGATRTDEGTEVLYAREHVVLAASAAGVDAIDTVYTDFGDEAGLATETEFAVTLGYDGKLAIHPAQVAVINDAFTPAPERIEWAQRVLAARDEASAEGRGVFTIDGEMIDAPLVVQAERIIARAEAAGEI